MPGFASVDYNPAAVAASLQSGLFPLHSPLLRESLLVSFPPLSYMLKFSGSSCVTETQKRESGTRLKKSQAPDGVVPPERGRRNLSTASPCRKRQISVLGWVLGANESLIPRLGQTEMKRSGATRAALSATTVVRNTTVETQTPPPPELREQPDGVMGVTSTPSRMLPGISRKRKMRSKV